MAFATKSAIFLIPAALILSGCVTPEQQAAQQEEYCRQIGAQTQQQMFLCRMQLQQQQIAQQEAQAAMWRGVGQALLTPQPQQPMRRPVTCNSQRVGNNVYTSCF